MTPKIRETGRQTGSHSLREQKPPPQVSTGVEKPELQLTIDGAQREV